MRLVEAPTAVKSICGMLEIVGERSGTKGGGEGERRGVKFGQVKGEGVNGLGVMEEDKKRQGIQFLDQTSGGICRETRGSHRVGSWKACWMMENFLGKAWLKLELVTWVEVGRAEMRALGFEGC